MNRHKVLALFCTLAAAILLVFMLLQGWWTELFFATLIYVNLLKVGRASLRKGRVSEAPSGETASS